MERGFDILSGITMASEAVATVLSRRCPRCSGFYPFDAEHVCADSGAAPTLQSPAAATVSVPAALAPTLEGPSPDTVPTAPGTAPAAATGRPAGRAEGRAALPADLVGLILGERYEILGDAAHKIINANLYIKNTPTRLFTPYKILRVDGMNILFIGIITQDVINKLSK